MKKYRVEPGSSFRLEHFDPEDTSAFKGGKQEALVALEALNKGWKNYKNCSLPKASTRCWWSCRPWMPAARMAPSGWSSTG